MTPTEFLALYPAFSDTARYPTASVQAELQVAGLRVSEERWSELRQHGIGLLTAHRLLLGSQAAAAAAVGGFGASGSITSKSVSKVSVSYDASGTNAEGAGDFNLTTYGREFWRLANAFGMGGLQL